MADRRLLLRTTVGLLIGLAVWAGLGPIYHRVVIAIAGAVLEVIEHPRMTDLHPDGNDVIVNRLDFPKSLGTRPSISLGPLTYNIILLTGLFAMAPRPLSDRNVLRFFEAALALAIVHVVALIVHIESIYALHLGAWSSSHYGEVARNAWGAAAHFYELFGIPAAAFALWFLLGETPLDRTPMPQKASKRGSR